MVVVDFETPSMTGRGVVCGFGYLDIAGLNAMMAGRFAPIQKAGDKQRPISNAWLAHPERRQYEEVVFAPGEPLPDNILNRWQGYAVEPVAGDVSLWLTMNTYGSNSPGCTGLCMFMHAPLSWANRQTAIAGAG